MRMSLKMENFCRAYVLGGVAKTAALEAGYSDSYARCRSHELLDHVGVRLGIEALRWEMREHNSENADAGGSFSYDEPRWRQRYLEVLWAVGSSSLEEMIVDGEMVEPDPGSLAWWAIKRWKQVPDGKGGKMPQIELHDKVSALREFGKATGFNVPLALQPTGKMAWKGPFSPFGAASMKDAFDPPGWSDMEREAAAAAGGAAPQGVGRETDKNRAFAPSFKELVAGGETDKNRSSEGGSEFDRKMGDRKNGAAQATDKNRAFAPSFQEMGAGEETDKNRAFAPSFQEMGAGEETDKNRAFEGGSDRGFGLQPPPRTGGVMRESGLGEPLRSDAGPASATGASEENRGTAIGRGLLIAPPLEIGAGMATDKYQAFEGGSDRGFGHHSPQSPQGQSGDWRTRETTDKDRGIEGGSDQSGDGREARRGIGAMPPQGRMPAGTPALPEHGAPVARSWTEHVAMLKSQPVEVLEPLVLRILNDPMWSGRRLTSSQVGEMLAELLHAVPYEVALKLAKRLEAEEGVTIIHC